jgi:hypothetical protein
LKRLLTISLLILSTFAHAQVEGSAQSQNASGTTFYYRMPIGWKLAAANRKLLIIVFPGSSTNSEAALYAQYPMKKWADGWTGKKVLAPGDTLYIAMVALVSTDVQSCAPWARVTNYIFANWQMDTTQMKALDRVSMWGYSEGGANISLPITNFCFDGTYPNDIRNRIKTFVTAANGTMQNLSFFHTYGARYWGFVDTEDNLVSNTTASYNAFNTDPTATPYRVKVSYPDVGSGPSAAHANIDDYVANYEGTNADDDIYFWLHDPEYNLGLDCRLLLNRYYDYRKTMHFTGGGYPDSLVIPGAANPEFGSSPAISESPFPAAKAPYQQASQVPGSLEWVYDFRGEYFLQSFWYYAIGASNTDSFFIYIGSEMSGWTRLSKVIVPNGQIGWQKITLPGTDVINRYVKVVVHGTWSGSPINSVLPPGIRKILFYGCPSGSIDTSAISPSVAPKNTRTFKQRQGINMTRGKVPWWMVDAYTHIRTQNENRWFSGGNESNEALVVYTPDFFNNIPGDEQNHTIGFGDSVRALEKTFLDVSVRTDQYKFGLTGIADDWFTDATYGNIYDTANLTRQAKLKAAKFAMYGPHSSTTYVFNITGMDPLLGSNDIQFFGLSNEKDGLFQAEDTATNYAGRSELVTNRFQPNKHTALAGQRAYDEFLLVGNGITSRLVMDTWVKNDSNNSKTLIEYSRQFRGFNIYPYASYNNYLARQYGSEVKGRHAVQYDAYTEFKAHVDALYRYDPTIELWITEIGPGRLAASQGSVSKPPGKDDGEWQAEMADWEGTEVMHAGVYRVYWYDLDLPDSTNTAFFGTHNRIYRNGSNYRFYPAFYFDRQKKNLMGDYYPDSILARQWQGVCVYKWQHSTQSNKYILEVGYADTATASFSGYVINVGNGATVNKYTFSYNSDNPTIESVTVTGGTITVSGDNRLAKYEVTLPNSNEPVKTLKKRNRQKRNL